MNVNDLVDSKEIWLGIQSNINNKEIQWIKDRIWEGEKSEPNKQKK